MDNYKKLEEIAGRYKALSLTYMTNGPWRPAYRTGNLYHRVSNANSANNMIKSRVNPYVISLIYAPEGAFYGKFVHNGTSRMQDRPFAQYAAFDAGLVKQINEFGGQIANEEFETMKEIIDDRFRKFFLK